MLKIVILLALVAFATSENEIPEEYLRTFRATIEDTKQELRLLETLSHEDDDDGTARSGLKDKIKEKLKKMCTCETFKSCVCCVEKEIKIPKINWSFTPKACFEVSVEPSTKMMKMKVGFGPVTVFDKETTFESIEQKCKKIEKFKNIEFCYTMLVTESEEKGLTTCLKLQANIMTLFNQPIYLPCLNFKDSKLTIDESFEGYEEGGIKLNLKGLWKKFKQLVGLEKKTE